MPNRVTTAARSVIALVVIVGLPGLGKSFVLKQFDTMLKAQQAKGLAGNGVLMLHKDQLTAEFKHANRGAKPSMVQIKRMILARVQAGSGAGSGAGSVVTTVVYNMNMNPDWFKGKCW